MGLRRFLIAHSRLEFWSLIAKIGLLDRSIGRPAELLQRSPKTPERHTHYVEIAAFDARYVAPSDALNSVRAGLIERLPGLNVGINFRIGKLCEVHAGDFFNHTLDSLRHADDCEARMNLVHAATQLSEHSPGIIGRRWLQQNLSLIDDYRIRSYYDEIPGSRLSVV